MKSPPDAGDSALGAWTITNPMVVWMLEHAPEMLTERPKSVRRRERPRLCPDPDCRRWTVFRAGVWKCYLHRPPLELVGRTPLDERAPRFDALAHIGDVLDYQIDPKTGRHVVIVIKC